MNKDKLWRRINGDIVPRPYDISIRRREWYWHFVIEISKQLGHESHLLDFLQFRYPNDAHSSLFFFIKEAERINIHLKGISYDQLYYAVVGIGRRVDSRSDLKLCPYMSCWEINQIVYLHLLDRCYWHVSNSMSIDEAYEALGRRVRKERMFDDIQIKDEDISYYKGIAGWKHYRMVKDD